MQDFKNWKTVKRGCIFILLVTALLFVASRMVDPVFWYAKGNIEDRNKCIAGVLSEEPNTIDVLVLGDSETYTSFSPLQLWSEQGIPAYVCGQSGQWMQEAYYILKKVLKKQDLKTVVLETNMFFRCQGIMQDMQLSLGELTAYYFPIFRYHNLWKEAFDKEEDALTSYKGFEIRSAVKPYEGGDYMQEEKEQDKLSAYGQLYFDQILRLCRKHEIQVVLYSVPSPSNCNYHTHDVISNLAKKKEILYVDLNLKLEELGIDWKKDSLDGGDHLNLSGAKKATAYLGQYLKDACGLEDRRGQDAYDEWDKKAKKYKKKVQKILKSRK